MRRPVKHTALYLILASAMTLAACGGGSVNELPYPTAPTVNTLPPSTPSPTPPVVTPPPVDTRISITGRVLYLRRFGPNDLDVNFRIDDFTIVNAPSTTPVHSGSLVGKTDFLREGQTVIAEGRRDGEFLNATKITIIAQ
jgi:hypothetical protein